MYQNGIHHCLILWMKSLNVTKNDTLHWKNYYKLQHGYNIRARWDEPNYSNATSEVLFITQLFQCDDWQQIVKLFHFEENAIDLYYYLIWILGGNMLLGLLISCTCHSYLISGFLQDVVSLLWQLCVFLVWTELWIRYKLYVKAKFQQFVTRLSLWLARDCGLVRW